MKIFFGSGTTFCASQGNISWSFSFGVAGRSYRDGLRENEGLFYLQLEAGYESEASIWLLFRVSEHIMKIVKYESRRTD